jgi:hypothetical protein
MDPALQEQINKRLTLNLLIQGAAAHSFITAHHMVRDELENVQLGLTDAYDRAVVLMHLNYYIGDIPLMHGFPRRFWSRIHSPKHPFHTHTLFRKCGWELTKRSHRWLVDRGRKLNVITIPVLHYFPAILAMLRTSQLDISLQDRLTPIAKRCVSDMLSIPYSQLNGEITQSVQFGNLDRPKTRMGQLAQQGAIGYGGVRRRSDGSFEVVARAWCWPLLVHELVKGTFELVCLHGLNSLNETDYSSVTLEADQIEYEAWMLQAGPEFWRLFLAAAPRSQSLPMTVMQIARLTPKALEDLMLQVVFDSPRAKDSLEQLASSYE